MPALKLCAEANDPNALLGVYENTIKNRIQAVTDALGEPVAPRAASLLDALELASLVRPKTGHAGRQN